MLYYTLYRQMSGWWYYAIIFLLGNVDNYKNLWIISRLVCIHSILLFTELDLCFKICILLIQFGRFKICLKSTFLLWILTNFGWTNKLMKKFSLFFRNFVPILYVLFITENCLRIFLNCFFWNNIDMKECVKTSFMMVSWRDNIVKLSNFLKICIFLIVYNGSLYLCWWFSVQAQLLICQLEYA